MTYEHFIHLVITLFYAFFVGLNVRAQVCEDQVGPSGQSDCPANKDHCTDPIWKEFMEEQCPVTCGVCTPTAQVGNGIYDDPKLIASINQDLNPCDDFYKYVCEGFLKNNAMLISRERPRIDQRTLFNTEMRDRQFAILENNCLTPENEEDYYVQQMYLFYDTCSDEAGRRRENSRAVLNKIAALKFSPHPLLAFNAHFLLKTSTIASKAEIETAADLGESWHVSAMPFYSHFISTNLRNSSRVMSNDGQPENQEETEKLRREMEEDPYKFMNYISIDEIKQYLTSFDLAQFWSAIIPPDSLSSQGLTSIDQMLMVTFPLKDLKEYDDMILSSASGYVRLFGVTFKYFPHQGDRLYAETFFPEDIRTSVTDLFDYIDEAFGDMLEEVDWMDDDTRDEALDKLDAMEIHIGYMDEIFDDERIEEIYRGYDLRAGMSYVEMIAMMDEWRAKYELEKLAETLPFYNSGSQTINAFYAHDRNLFFAMMSHLQGLFYTQDRPTVMNFGAIGFVLSHEVTHGFDHQGSKHDASGTIRDWWDPETKQSFNEEKQCIIDQYSNYIFKLNETYSQPLDGVLMQGENIADHGGIRAACKAWQYFLDDVEDGLAEDPSETYSIGTIEDFTDEQLFFIASGFMNCEQTSSELQYNILNNGWNDHAPGEARVNQVYRNQPEFARAFRCPRGSGMNPTQKCAVW